MPDSELSRLLAGRNQLGRVEKEAVLDHVLAEVAPRRAGRRWLMLAVPALAAAALALWLVPRGGASRDELAARGGGGRVAMFAPACAGGCTRDAKLLLDVHGTTGYRYFAAFAKAPDGGIVWYATERDLTRDVDHDVLVDAVVLGADHPRGTYRVFGVFSDRPLARDAIRSLFDAQGHAQPAPGIEVVERELVIQ